MSAENIGENMGEPGPQDNLPEANHEIKTVLDLNLDFAPTDATDAGGFDPGSEGTIMGGGDSAPNEIIKRDFISLNELGENFDFCYNMQHKKRGLFVVFNQMEFDKHLKLSERKGSDKDADSLLKTAELLGFKTEEYRDLERKQIRRKLYELSEMDHGDHDCFACAILTHGGKENILYSHDDEMKLKDFTTPFEADKCRSLASKPKLFFVQACRGDLLDRGAKGIHFKQPTGDMLDFDPSKVESHSIPVQADFLISQATAPDYYAWRSSDKGSIFIQTLCSVFDRYSDEMDLMKILTRVNRVVAFNFESWTQRPDMNHMKQIPSITSQLTAELFIKKLKRNTNPST
ncbi:caspase-3 [Ciona intestinalis]